MTLFPVSDLPHIDTAADLNPRFGVEFESYIPTTSEAAALARLAAAYTAERADAGDLYRDTVDAFHDARRVPHMVAGLLELVATVLTDVVGRDRAATLLECYAEAAGA